MKDVARFAGVSPKTVSRVMNNEPSVKEAKRMRVLKAIAELSYRPNLSARSLRGAKSYAIGLVYDNPNPHYIIALQDGALSVCRKLGFGLQVHPCDSKAPKLALELCDVVHRANLAGLILAPPMSEQPELIRFLAKANIHFVRILSALEDPDDGYPCVYVNDRAAAYAITVHLIKLGHTRIGFLWGGKKQSSSMERYQGYATALRDHGIAVDKKLAVEGDYRFEDGFRGARKLLALKERPTAIFGSNDEIAAGALAAAKSVGINVPDDLSISGFEDSPFSRQSWPALTTAHQEMDQVAQYATQLLIAQLDDDAASMHNKGFSPVLVSRDSTVPPRHRTNDEAKRPAQSSRRA
jgi:LacI family transcriptional regulator